MSKVDGEHRVFITGHRPDRLWGYDLTIDKYTELRERIKRHLESVKCTDAYTGMALGADTVFAQAVLEMKDAGKNIRLHCIVPCAHQDAVWPSSSREMYHNILDRADEVVHLSESDYTPELMIERNHWLVDNCDEGIGVINSDVSRVNSGTAETLGYAEKQEVGVYLIDIGTGINKQRAVSERARANSKDITLKDLDTWYYMDDFIVMDTETTGFSFLNGCAITDVGAVEVKGNTIVSRYEQLVNPGQPIPADITKLTGISDIMVKYKPDIITVLPVMVQYVGNKPVIFHNSEFDYNKFIKPMYDTYKFNELNWNVLCSLKMDRFLRPAVKSHKLGNVYKDLTGKEMHNSHRALTDALMTAEVSCILQSYIRANYKDLRKQLENKG